MCGISGKGHEMRFYDSYERYVDSLADDLKWMGGGRMPEQPVRLR